MKILMTILLAGFIGLNAFSQSGIKFFEGSWDEALKASKYQNKTIFLDAYAAWCGPCRWMAANVFTDEEVGKFYNENFINYKLDMEKGEGPQVKRTYQVSAYPTFLFINSEGAVLYRLVGARAPEEFLLEGKKAIQQLPAVEQP